MRILLVGGTRFIGRHAVERALARGHRVTIFHRGATGADLFPAAEHRLGDRNSDLSALTRGEWDATVDTCAYFPAQVHALADALGGRGGRHLLVSSVSAYARVDGPGLTEDAPLAELADPTVGEVTSETYGGLKALCERAAVERHGPRTLLVRPTYVVGPHDYTWRFPWWVARIARGGEVLVPGPRDAPAQVVDVRDLAGWMVRLLEDGRCGAYHAACPAPVFTWGQQIEAIADAVAPAGTSLTWVDARTVHGWGLPEGTFPLWSGGDPDRWRLAADPSKAYGAGLAPRPLADTVRDTLAWTRTVRPPDGAGLAPDREREHLAAWRGTG